MTRHARNCTAGAVYTYNEKKRDAATAGYGTNSQRIGKDSVKSFDCCSLTLQPCRNPVITKDGYLFDKEAILQYIISKQNEYSRKLKEYQRIKRAEETQKIEELSTKHQQFINKFITSTKPIMSPAEESKLLNKNVLSGNGSKNIDSISNMSNGNEKKLPSFWIPSECPNSSSAKMKKPDPTIYCPISNKPLKVKDLIDVKFTQLNDHNNNGSLIVKEARYICPVTRDVLTNAVQCVVLRPTGDVVTLECVEKLIKKDMIHPLTNQKLKKEDLIPLQRGGTGYAQTNVNLKSKETHQMLPV